MEKKITTYGKWILAGEYSVLKNYPALVFPLSSCFIKIITFSKFKKNFINRKVFSDSFNKNFSQKNSIFYDNSPIAVKVFYKVFKRALQKLSKKWEDLPFVSIQLFSCLPFGLGLGASASVCVLSGRLLESIGWLKKSDLFLFCHSLENTLHSHSSGLDIAGVLNQKPLLYQKKSSLLLSKTPQLQTLHLKWKPLIFLSTVPSSSQKGDTKTNVQKWKKTYACSIYIEKMNQAVLLAKKSLSEKTMTKKNRLNFLQKSFELAEECFLEWNLVGKEMKKHIAELKQKGALAAKPTGSGECGYVLSLWNHSPPHLLKKQLIPGFS